MKKLLVITLFLIAAVCTFAQPFNQISNPFPGMGRGATSFADLDNDNDLDLLMCGQDNTFSPIGLIYINNNGEFTLSETTFTGLYNCGMSLADYDHDGLIDFIITGQDFSGNATRLYRNVGSMRFQLTDSTLYAAGADGDVAFGDYDNDGYADIVLSGNWNTKLYHNNGTGTFTEVTTNLPAMNSPSVAWGDYDNDGDLDLLMVGDDGSVTTYIMNNEGGVFTQVNVQLDGAIGGSARWGDYDLDGYLDILITGKDWSLLPVSFIYHNDSDNSFSNAYAGLVGTALGPADWIDFDNDGDLDIMLSGQNAGCGNSSTILYVNDGIGGYSQFANLAFVERGASAWGDYDNDGDSDLLLTGISGTATRYFYKNDLITGAFQQNTSPTVPQVTDIFTWMDYVIVNWNRSTDLQSPPYALSYNLRIGSTPGGIDIVAPGSDVSNGLRYLNAQGNMGSNVFGIIRDLEPGTYYFSLQAIDQSYAASEFSQEQSFIILPTSVSSGLNDEADISVSKAGDYLLVNTNEKTTSLSLFTITGQLIQTGQISDKYATLNISNLKQGLYILRMNSGNRVISKKISL